MSTQIYDGNLGVMEPLPAGFTKAAETQFPNGDLHQALITASKGRAPEHYFYCDSCTRVESIWLREHW
jgi:hypothetical protein